jgi:ribonuclease D
LDRRQLAVLESLLQWRDEEARRRDCPLYKVLGNQSLQHLAKLKPTERSKLQEVEGLSPRLIERYGAKLLQQVAMGLDLSEAELPVYPRGERRQKDLQVEKRIGRLKDWRKNVAAELGLDPGVLINNALLDELARKQPRSEQDFAQIELLKNWQRKVLGEGILRALS